ncbi:MAG: aminotransferase class V-fold PLP-dependent enzyme [Bryobacteraceae bacterium]
MTDPLLAWRKEFPILDRTVYMISHSLGAMPRRTRDRLTQFADQWDTRGIRAWEEGWWEMPVTVGNLIGKIIGAGEGEIVMQQNVSICQQIVLSCFDWTKRRNKIVTDSMNFPSNLYNYGQLRTPIATIPSQDGLISPLKEMLEAMDDQTALVSVSHVLFRSSYIQDLAALTRRAHEVGAKIVADVYQSAGTVPLNVRELGVDFAVGGSVKWLCGGPGAGFLYVRRDLWPELEPRMTGWAAHRHPFLFAQEHDYDPGINRFQNGTPNVPAMYSAMSGYEIVGEIGVPAIREKSMRQTAKLIELAENAGFHVNSPRNPHERGGTVVIDVPNGYEVSQELGRRDYLVDYRPGAGIRVAPHFYSTDEELELVIREIKTVSLQSSALPTL